ncbi:MAG TPA: GTPase Era [Beijerinckiaceae bacterium]|jgi:GTP-binding protein Era|nr:GTPase Era [Beijerinckiaceae bacterium]
MTENEMKRCGFVALVGAPNAGKSTLVNALVGSKVSIVSRKAQTTRSQVRGIAIVGGTQLVFVDTPGIFAPKRRLDKAMVSSAWSGAADADAILLIVDARRGVDDEVEAIVTRLADLRVPRTLALNKVDLVERPALLTLSAALNARLSFAETFMISALTGDGLERVRDSLAAMMKPGPWLYPDDQISDAPLRSLAAEITREAILDRLHDELPYQLTVETDQWKDMRDGSVRIEQTIYVAREGHKKIVIGEKGQMLKTIGTIARKAIAEAADTKVHLFLFVKVREKWADDPERYREMGLEFPRD